MRPSDLPSPARIPCEAVPYHSNSVFDSSHLNKLQRSFVNGEERNPTRSICLLIFGLSHTNLEATFVRQGVKFLIVTYAIIVNQPLIQHGLQTEIKRCFRDSSVNF